VAATLAGVAPAAFDLVNLVGFPGSIEIASGASQEAPVFSAYGTSLGVHVEDAYGNPVPGATVSFAVVTTGAQTVTLSSEAATTDAGGDTAVSATAGFARGALSVRASVEGAAAPAVFFLTNTSIATQVSVEIGLPVLGTVVTEDGVTRLQVTVGPGAGGLVPGGTVTLTASRPIEMVPGQAGVSQVGGALVATLADGAATIDVRVVGWHSRSATLAYAPDEPSAPTFDPSDTTFTLDADDFEQEFTAGGCSTGGGGSALLLLPLALFALRRNRRSAGDSAMKKLLPLATLAVLLAPATASAQYSVGVRVGYAVATGDAIAGDPMSEGLKGQIPIQIEGGYRLLPPLTVGAFASWGPGRMGSVCAGGSCSGSVLRLGVQGSWSFPRIARLAPWAGLGLGYEWASYQVEAEGETLEVRQRGFQVLSVQGGADLAVLEALAVGPYVQLDVGRYGRFEVVSPLGSSSGSPQAATHTWISFGIRGKYDL
jgi:hypothetical protein